MTKKGTPRYLNLAQRAAAVRFRSAAQARIPNWSVAGRTKRSPEVKRATEERVRKLASNLSPHERQNFFRAYRTMVAGRIRALETAQDIFQKHAKQIASKDYRTHRKGLLTFRNELKAAAGEETTYEIMALLGNAKIFRRIPTPVFRTEKEAFELVVKHENIAKKIIRRRLARFISSSRLKHETDEMYENILTNLMERCRQYNSSLYANFDAFFDQSVRRAIEDQIRVDAKQGGFLRKKGRVAEIVSIDEEKEWGDEDEDRSRDHGLEDPLPPRRQQIHELREVLFKGFERLPPRQREIVFEYFVNGKTFHQIGKQIKLSESYVTKEYKRAIARLRELLSGKGLE